MNSFPAKAQTSRKRGGPGKMEIGDEGIHDAIPVSWIDEKLREAPPPRAFHRLFWKRPSPGCAPRSCPPRRPGLPFPLPVAQPPWKGLIWSSTPGASRAFHILALHEEKSAYADIKRDLDDADAHILRCRQSRSASKWRPAVGAAIDPSLPGVDGLISLVVIGLHRLVLRPLDIVGKGHPAVAGHKGRSIDPFRKLDRPVTQAPAGVTRSVPPTDTLRLRRPLLEARREARPSSARRSFPSSRISTRPPVSFTPASRAGSPSYRSPRSRSLLPRRYAVISLETAVLNAPVRPVEHKETGSGPLLRRMLRDQAYRQ